MTHEEFAKKTLNNFVTTHLSEEELADYHDGTVGDGITRTRLEAHLQRCLICQRRLEFLREVTAEAAGIEPSQIPEIYYETAQRLLHPVRETLRALGKWLRELFIYHLTPEPQFAFATPGEPLDLESEDGKYGIFVEEDQNHNVIVRVDSTEMELAGTPIHFYAGEWQREVRLEKVEDDQVGAEVVITPDERAALPTGTDLRAKLVAEEDNMYQG